MRKPIPILFLLALPLGFGGRPAAAAHRKVAARHHERATAQLGAYDYFTRAGAALVEREKIAEAAGLCFDNQPPDRALLQKLLAENARSLQLLRTGFKLPFVQPRILDIDAPLPPFAAFRDLSLLLFLEGRLKQARGDALGSCMSFIDGMRIGVSIPRGGPIVSMLAGVVCETPCRHGLWDVVNQLDATQAAKVGAALRQLDAARVPLEATLRNERELDLTSVLDHTRSVAPYIWWMHREIAQLAQPYAVRKPIPIPNDQACRVMFVDYQRLDFVEARTLALQRLLLTAVALRGYQVEHDANPATLADLVPRYLPKVPEDPFTLGHGLSYKVDALQYTLYSLGPDLRDDGGVPIAGDSDQDATRYTVLRASKGDIVGGVNR